MKFLLCILFLISLNVQARVCDEVRAFVDQAGTVKSRVECSDRVTNTESDLISAGAVVVLSVVSDNAVGVSLSSSRGSIPHCVMKKSCAAFARNCECIMRGFSDTILFDGVTENSAGHFGFISTSTTGNIEAITTPTQAAYDKPVGRFLDSADSAGAVEFFIDL